MNTHPSFKGKVVGIPTRDPVNRQAALVIRSANWIEQPVHDISKSKPIEDPLVAYRNELRKQIEEKEAAIAEQDRIRKLNVVTKKPKHKVKKCKCNWATRHLRILHKQAGKPPPTSEQIQAYKRAQPNYGTRKFGGPA